MSFANSIADALGLIGIPVNEWHSMSKIPLRPDHPERICWGCDRYCPAEDLACGNGTIRTAHPCELFGDDWLEWSVSGRKHANTRTTPDTGTPGS